MEYLNLTLTHTLAIGAAMVLGTAIDTVSERQLKKRGPVQRIAGQFALNLVVLALMTRVLRKPQQMTHHIFFLSVLLNVQTGLFNSISRYFQNRVYNPNQFSMPLFKSK